MTNAELNAMNFFMSSCASAVPTAPGVAPMIYTGFPFHEVFPQGRLVQSRTFLSGPGIERLYSGVEMITPSAASIFSLSACTYAGEDTSSSWLNIGVSDQ